jgi:hypothetical protein
MPEHGGKEEGNKIRNPTSFMKKITVCLALAALALAPAMRADDSKASNKAATTEKAKASVPKPALAEKGDCCEKGECSSKETFTKKAVKPAEKGATFLAKK